jgi:hypothetical protein
MQPSAGGVAPCVRRDRAADWTMTRVEQRTTPSYHDAEPDRRSTGEFEMPRKVGIARSAMVLV